MSAYGDWVRKTGEDLGWACVELGLAKSIGKEEWEENGGIPAADMSDCCDYNFRA